VRLTGLELAAAALGAVLRAAVSRHRFAAMDAFNAMLVSVKTPELAMAVAQMLRARMDDYHTLAANVPASKLHAAIRQVQAIAPGELSDEKT
jgi:hypothetical protein